MYNVYIITFQEHNAIYVGCTNNIRRRKDQHNQNAKNQHGKFGLFLHDNEIVLKESDMVVIKRYHDRKQALQTERQMVLSFNKTDINVLNDNYSMNCSRKNKLSIQMSNAEEWVIVDFVNHKTELAFPLRKYCEQNGFCYKGMHGSSVKTHAYRNQYKAFKSADWEALSDAEKDLFVSGVFLKQIAQKNLEKHIKKASKKYIVMFPDGHEEVVENLDKFAREHKINDGNLHASVKNGRAASGYKARKVD